MNRYEQHLSEVQGPRWQHPAPDSYDWVDQEDDDLFPRRYGVAGGNITEDSNIPRGEVWALNADDIIESINEVSHSTWMTGEVPDRLYVSPTTYRQLQLELGPRVVYNNRAPEFSNIRVQTHSGPIDVRIHTYCPDNLIISGSAGQ